ncbi:MAG: RNA 2',3'-cyclic phosphodiesterase [Gemmatimonadetes bacterium]|nr:MAG: RNA 2',3'-cyclic phosphodiesterase [Gemmatimonadota bacterium]
MRLFIALNFPKKERERIHRAARPLREAEMPVRWVEPANYHITLKFLDEVPEARVGAVVGALESVAANTPPIELELGGFGAFPTIRRPRVIWLGADPSPALRCLKQDIEWALSDAGFPRETRAFHPHVTLGRAAEDGGAGAFRGLDELAAGLDYRGVVRVRSLDLMRSTLSRSGARYSIERSVTLGG